MDSQTLGGKGAAPRCSLSRGTQPPARPSWDLCAAFTSVSPRGVRASGSQWLCPTQLYPTSPHPNRVRLLADLCHQTRQSSPPPRTPLLQSHTAAPRSVQPCVQHQGVCGALPWPSVTRTLLSTSSASAASRLWPSGTTRGGISLPHQQGESRKCIEYL